MPEQAVVADLRVNLTKFDADLKKAMSSADSASANITKALNKVDASVKSIPAEVNKLNQSLQQTEQATNRAAQATERQTQVIGRLKGVLGSLGLILTAQQMIQFALSTVKAAEALTSIEQQFVMLTGSQKAARAEMAFIRAETDRLALSTLEGAKGYARLANAAAGTKLQGEGVRQVFIALNTMTRALRLSNEEYGRVLNQVTQIISKGRIQTEELITLAESGIPIFTMLAKSMNVSGEALSDMLQKGKVSSQALILLVDGVQKKYAQLAKQAAETVPAQIERGWNRLLSEVTDVVQGILRSGELLNAFKFDNKTLDIFPDREVITANVDYILRQFLAIDLIIKAVWERAGQSIVEFFEKAREKLAALNDFMQNLPGVKWAQEQFKAITGSLDKVAESTSKTKTEMGRAKDFFTAIFGGDGQAAIRAWNALVSEGLEKFGKEMPSPVNSEKIVADAEHANAELMKLQEQAKKDLAALQEEARQEKRHKDVATEDEAMKTIASMRRRLDDEAFRDQERNRKQLIESANDAAKAIQKIRLELEDAVQEEQDKTHEDFLKILERTNKERIAQDQKPIEDFNETIKNMKKDIQSELGTTISDALRGDLDNIKDVASRIQDIFTETIANIASKLIAAFAIDPIVNQLKPLIAKLQGLIGQAGTGGQTTTGGQIIGGVGALGVGAAVGMGVSPLAGGGKAGGIIGGALGGASSGAYIGSAFPPYGTIIGAAVGAIVGGIAGGLMSKSEDVKELVMQTTAGWPTAQETSSFARSPFGMITLFEESSASREVAASATMAISEIDSAIAKYLDKSQREIVENYFQSAVPEGQQVRSKDADDAIAKAIQQRLYQALTALSGEDVARNVVGELYTADKGNIAAIQARAMEALEILATIADFKAGDLSQTAQQIKAINEQFQYLQDRATVLGLPVDEIIAEQEKQIAEIATNFNEGIGDAILGITDPAKLELVQLERMQAERMQNAIDAGADLAQVEELNRLEREEYEKRHQEKLTDITEAGQKEREAATANIFQAIYSITDPFKAALLSIQMQVAAFQAQADQGLIPQSLVDRYEDTAVEDARKRENERLREEAQAVEDFNQDIADSLATFNDDYAREMLDMDRMHAERYSKAIEMGADLNAVAELNHAEREQAERDHQDRLNEIQAQKQKEGEDALNNVFMMIWQMEDPFRATLLGIEIQWNQLQDLVAQGLIPQSLADRWHEDALEKAKKDENDRLKQEAKAVEDFNYDINQSILKLTNSYQAELNEQNRIHDQRYDYAVANGADINAVIALNNLEKMQLADDYANESFDNLQRTLQAQADATANIVQMIYDIEDPFMGALFRLQQQAALLQAQVESGLISAQLFTQWIGLAFGQMFGAENDRQIRIIQQEDERIERETEQGRAATRARKEEADRRRSTAAREAEQRKREAQQQAEQRKREAEQRKREAQQRAEQRKQEAEQRRQDKLSFNSALYAFTDPFKASMQDINEQVREFRAMTKEGIISKKAVDQFQRLAMGSLEIDRALQAIGGGGGSPIEEVGDAFKEFIKAGSPQSEAVQQMAALQEQFAGLVESAKILGLSTKDLKDSYMKQAKVIREEAIDAINEEMDAKKEQLKQIDEFLASMRVSDFLPPEMRLDEARKQFGEAVQSGDVGKAVSASDQYLGIAQEQFGTTQQFFSARNEVEQMLTNMRDQQARNIESEREKLIRQEERQLEQVQIGRSSVDYLRRISSDNSATSRGIEQLINIARSQTSEQVATRQLLLRLAAKMKA